MTHEQQRPVIPQPQPERRDLPRDTPPPSRPHIPQPRSRERIETPPTDIR
jgi:hypothetical protein